MIEVVGDASRNGDWALRHGSDRRRPHRRGRRRRARASALSGLTLLEAAAVPRRAARRRRARRRARPRLPGRARPRAGRGRDERRRRQRRRAASRRAAGDRRDPAALARPEGPDSERACCSPAAVVAARETCHALGLPHVTLDLRDEFRRRVVQPFVAGYARGETPEPLHPLQRRLPLRRAARLRAQGRALPASRPATTRASSSATAGCCSPGRPTRDKDQSYMLAALDPRRLPRLWFPLGDQGKAETRAEAAAAGLAVAGRAREPGGVLPRRRRLPRVPRAPRTRVERGSGRRRGGPGARPPRGLLAFHAGPAEGHRRGRRDRRCTRCAPSRGPNTVVVGPREALACTRARARGRLYVPVTARRRRSFATARRRSRPRSTPTARGFGLRARAPGVRRREGPGGRALRRRRRRRRGPSLGYRAPSRDRSDTRLTIPGEQ